MKKYIIALRKDLNLSVAALEKKHNCYLDEFNYTLMNEYNRVMSSGTVTDLNELIKYIDALVLG